MRLKVLRILVVVCASIALPHLAFGRTLFPSEEEFSVVGEGVVVLALSQTLNSAYELAENKAKLDASSQVGQYMEVVKRTDTSTGEVEEIVTSVNATLMQYKVIGRTAETVGANVVVKVKVSGKYKPLDMQLAMSKYFGNQVFRDEVNQITDARDKLQVEVENHRALFKALVAAVADDNQATVVELNKQLEGGYAKSSKEFGEYGVVLQQTQAVYIRLDGASDLDKREQLRLERESIDSAYLAALNATLATLENQTDVSVEDIAANSDSKTVVIRPGWKVDMTVAQHLFSKGASGSISHYRDRMWPVEPTVFQGLGDSQEHDVKRQYSVFYVAELDGLRYELPLILPVANSRRSRFDSTCSDADVVGVSPKAPNKADMLCLAFYYLPFDIAYSYHKGPWIAKRVFDGKFKVSVPVGKDVVVKTRFELRQAVTNELIKAYSQGNTTL